MKSELTDYNIFFIGPVVTVFIVGFHFLTRRKPELNKVRRFFHYFSMFAVGAGIYWISGTKGWGPLVGVENIFGFVVATIFFVGNSLSVDFCNICGRMYSTVPEPKFRICGECQSRVKADE